MIAQLEDEDDCIAHLHGEEQPILVRMRERRERYIPQNVNRGSQAAGSEQ